MWRPSVRPANAVAVVLVRVGLPGSCYWPKAQNLGGLGAAPPGGNERTSRAWDERNWFGRATWRITFSEPLTEWSPECHCEARRAAALRAGGDEAISIPRWEIAWVPKRELLRLGALRFARNDLLRFIPFETPAGLRLLLPLLPLPSICEEGRYMNPLSGRTNHEKGTVIRHPSRCGDLPGRLHGH